MSEEKEVAMVEVEKSVYPIAVLGGNMVEALAENLGGETLSASDLQRVKVPSGGQTAWMLEDIDGEEIVKTFQGIIVFHKLARAYWAISPDDEEVAGNPPDCSSPDSITGYGDPGGNCESCEFAQYGSALKGEGQACKLVRQLFIVREGELLPLMLNVPPSSLKEVKSYLVRLAAKGRKYHSVVTEFSLVKAQSKAGKDYVKIHCSVAESLTPEQAAAVAEYAKEIRGSLEKVRGE